MITLQVCNAHGFCTQWFSTWSRIHCIPAASQYYQVEGNCIRGCHWVFGGSSVRLAGPCQIVKYVMYILLTFYLCLPYISGYFLIIDRLGETLDQRLKRWRASNPQNKERPSRMSRLSRSLSRSLTSSISSSFSNLSKSTSSQPEQVCESQKMDEKQKMRMDERLSIGMFDMWWLGVAFLLKSFP